jgi:hypothetical protein
MIEIDEIHQIYGMKYHLLYESNSAFWKVWAEGQGTKGLGLSKEEALWNAKSNIYNANSMLNNVLGIEK